MLDLVAGHTSIEHPWFQRELAADGPDPEGDRYIWREELPATSWERAMPGTPAWVPSPGPRRGYYLKNFYDQQPALNFGWVRPGGPGRDAVDAPGPLRNRQALKDIIGFWLDRGVAGFRVDMAFSLVKDELWADGITETVALWGEIRTWLEDAYPDAVLIPEGTEPRTGKSLAFDADFFLVIFDEHGSLFDNHYAGVLPFRPAREPFFDADGKGSMSTFLAGWNAAREADPGRLIVMSTADHDFDRLRCGPRTPQQLPVALTFLFTWGNVPCLYYGDEIGMRYLPDMPDVEGAICNPGYNRAGCRTPMQWDDGPNAGFSTAPAERLYLPVDPAPDRPTVAAQENDDTSTLHFVRDLIALRKATPALGTRASTRVIHDGYPLAYVRNESHLIVLNPRREPATLAGVAGLAGTPLLAAGITPSGDGMTVDGFGYGIFTLD
jgi:glycosidase